MARQGMAATSQPLATATAIRVLQQGGNAIDAAIAANAVLGVVEPMSCGIGGDLFAIVWDAKTKKLYGLNASGRAPAAATIDLFKAKGLRCDPDARAALSWSVPGCVDGWDQLRQRFGTKAVARAARAGDRLRRDRLSRSARSSPPTGGTPSASLAQIPTSAACYLPGGHAPQPGAIFRNPGLARSLRTIAQDGRDAFYRGPLAEAIVRYSQSVGGLFALSDFAEHTSNVRRSGLDQLSRLRRLGAAPQRPGDRRAPDAQPARAVRPQEHGPAVGRGPAPDDRGQEAGLRGSGQVLRRPRFCEAAGRDPDLQALRRPAPARAESPIGPTSIPCRATRCRPTRST